MAVPLYNYLLVASRSCTKNVAELELQPALAVVGASHPLHLYIILLLLQTNSQLLVASQVLAVEYTGM